MEDERRKQLEKIKREKEEKDRILAQVLNKQQLINIVYALFFQPLPVCKQSSKALFCNYNGAVCILATKDKIVFTGHRQL